MGLFIVELVAKPLVLFFELSDALFMARRAVIKRVEGLNRRSPQGAVLNAVSVFLRAPQGGLKSVDQVLCANAYLSPSFRENSDQSRGGTRARVGW
jgi:hypothetical protein